MNMKITGIKKAVDEYHRANAGGYYSPSYGIIMLDRSTGEVWTDCFYDLGHNSFKAYDDPAIINISRAIEQDHESVCMSTVKEYAERMCTAYSAE